ncbi:hypothetical protein HYH03_010582 [Edaphochlamys debaryana]|uniref:Uncharacterized protein n=1 Tax=Edaphochlamys debaryana TaxID=47281 RepID=A0A836BW65_9CHLO|nr:hypothetical protein HYH03_010582 [Edaphochlamys debaryana]|eukprot:KAG2491140.1 hypothetical protein HYH03_010582 [Edaphochlamys debaryana]
MPTEPPIVTAPAPAPHAAQAPAVASAVAPPPAPSPTAPGTTADPADSVADLLAAVSSTLPVTSSSAPRGGDPEKPYTRHSVSLPSWQPPPTSLQRRSALTRALLTSPSYARLHALLLDNAADFNVHHTTAALSRVLQLQREGLSPREARLFKEGCSTLQTVLRRQVPDLSPRAIVVAAHALAKLELPDRELLPALAAAVEPQLRALQPQGLSTLLWAFAAQGHQPPPKWMDSYLAAAAATLPGWGDRDLATLLWALARLHYKAAPAKLQLLLDHAESQLGGFSGRSLSNGVYALALSQQHPGEAWLRAAQARAAELGPGAFTPQGLTQMAWGMARLGCSPSPAFTQLVLDHAEAGLPEPPPPTPLRDGQPPEAQQQGTQEGQGQGRARGGRGQRRSAQRYNGQDLSTLLYSLAVWGAAPPAALARRLMLAVQYALPRLETHQLCNCIWSCARLGLYPSASWLRDWYDASYRQLPYFKPVDLSQSLWGLARLSAVPPQPWLAAALTRLQHAASMFTPVEVASCLWALAKLGVAGERLPGEVLALFFIATDRRLSSFKPQELCSMLWALARMRRRPDKEWTAEFLKASFHKLPSMSGWCLATLAWALAELSDLGLHPPPAWIYALVNAARQRLAAAPPVAAPPAAALDGPAAPSTGANAPLSALDLAQLISGLRRLSAVCGGLAKVDDWVREAEGALAEAEARSGAFAEQQVRALQAMGPREARLAAAFEAAEAAEACARAAMQAAASAAEANGNGVVAHAGGEGLNGANGVATHAAGAELQVQTQGAKTPRAPRRRQPKAQPQASEGAESQPQAQAQPGSKPRRAQPRRPRKQPAEAAVAALAAQPQPEAHDAPSGPSARKGAAWAAPLAEPSGGVPRSKGVHVGLGLGGEGLSVELGSPSGPVSLRAGGDAGAAAAAGGAAGPGVDGSSAAEIRRRLLSV